MAPVLSQSVRLLGELGRKELRVYARLHGDAKAALERMELQRPELREARRRAYAYAVFPSVGQSSAVLGGGWGMGELLKGGHLVGYAALLQLTLGVQLGGQTISEVVLFSDRAAYEHFRKAGTGLTLGAAATLMKAGVAATSRPKGSTDVYVATSGGMWAGVDIGAQRIFSFPAVLGRSAALRATVSALPFFNDPRSTSAATRGTEDTMAKARLGKAKKDGLRGQNGQSKLKALIPWGRQPPVEEKGPVRTAVEHAGARGRDAIEAVRERLPSGEELRESAGRAREWTAEKIGQHAVALGLTTLAAGLAGAAMLPVSDRERRAYSAVSGRVKQAGHAVSSSEAGRAARALGRRTIGIVEDEGFEDDFEDDFENEVEEETPEGRASERKESAPKRRASKRETEDEEDAPRQNGAQRASAAKRATPKRAGSRKSESPARSRPAQKKPAQKKTASASRRAQGHAPAASRKPASRAKASAGSRANAKKGSNARAPS